MMHFALERIAREFKWNKLSGEEKDAEEEEEFKGRKRE